MVLWIICIFILNDTCVALQITIIPSEQSAATTLAHYSWTMGVLLNVVLLLLERLYKLCVIMGRVFTIIRSSVNDTSLFSYLITIKIIIVRLKTVCNLRSSNSKRNLQLLPPPCRLCFSYRLSVCLSFEWFRWKFNQLGKIPRIRN